MLLKEKSELEIDDTFPNEHLLAAPHNLISWFTDFANFLASDIIPKLSSENKVPP